MDYNIEIDAASKPVGILMICRKIKKKLSIRIVIASFKEPYGFLMFSENRERVHWKQVK